MAMACPFLKCFPNTSVSVMEKNVSDITMLLLFFYQGRLLKVCAFNIRKQF